MRIIEVNKYNYPRGGADKYFLDISEALRTAGHEVAVFSMRHPKNLPSPWEKYFVSRVSYNEPKLRDRLIAPGRMIYSLETVKKFKSLIKDFKPDIIHLHNIYHQLSPSLIDVAKKAKIPVVMHLHDYKLFCPNHTLYTKKQICHKCFKHNYYEAVLNKCFNNSWPQSLGVCLEMYIHHCLWKVYERDVNLFITPSAFMKEVALKFDWPANKFKVLRNFSDPKLLEAPLSEAKGDYLLYAGRLSAEKGIKVLLKALKFDSSLKLKIAGSGPEEASLKKLATALEIDKQVEFLGQLDKSQLDLLIADAQALIIPSVWLENMPLILLEALSAGKTVIASRLGGFKEIIKDGHNGFLFEANNPKALAETIKTALAADAEVIALAARKTASEMPLDKHLAELLKFFQA